MILPCRMEVAWGPLPQAELVASLRLEKSSVSQLVGRLEQRRWLARERDPADGRAVLRALDVLVRAMNESGGG